jgi:hypothetical protein
MKKSVCITLFICVASTLLWGQNFSEEAFAKRRALFAREARTGVAILSSTTAAGGLNKNF